MALVIQNPLINKHNSTRQETREYAIHYQQQNNKRIDKVHYQTRPSKQETIKQDTVKEDMAKQTNSNHVNTSHTRQSLTINTLHDNTLDDNTKTNNSIAKCDCNAPLDNVTKEKVSTETNTCTTTSVSNITQHNAQKIQDNPAMQQENQESVTLLQGQSHDEKSKSNSQQDGSRTSGELSPKCITIPIEYKSVTIDLNQVLYLQNAIAKALASHNNPTLVYLEDGTMCSELDGKWFYTGPCSDFLCSRHCKKILNQWLAHKSADYLPIQGYVFRITEFNKCVDHILSIGTSESEQLIYKQWREGRYDHVMFIARVCFREFYAEMGSTIRFVIPYCQQEQDRKRCNQIGIYQQEMQNFILSKIPHYLTCLWCFPCLIGTAVHYYNANYEDYKLTDAVLEYCKIYHANYLEYIVESEQLLNQECKSTPSVVEAMHPLVHDLKIESNCRWFYQEYILKDIIQQVEEMCHGKDTHTRLHMIRTLVAGMEEELLGDYYAPKRIRKLVPLIRQVLNNITRKMPKYLPFKARKISPPSRMDKSAVSNGKKQQEQDKKNQKTEHKTLNSTNKEQYADVARSTVSK
jgi:hypothetical protein